LQQRGSPRLIIRSIAVDRSWPYSIYIRAPAAGCFRLLATVPRCELSSWSSIRSTKSRLDEVLRTARIRQPDIAAPTPDCAWWRQRAPAPCRSLPGPHARSAGYHPSRRIHGPSCDRCNSYCDCRVADDGDLLAAGAMTMDRPRPFGSWNGRPKRRLCRKITRISAITKHLDTGHPHPYGRRLTGRIVGVLVDRT
jgi:hypothetical protein